MKVCIRCNPVSELQETEEGLRCRIHGVQYVLEEQPDPVPADPPADAPLPVETVAYPDGTEATGVAPLPEQSPASEPAAPTEEAPQ